jgi:hypothetical protein
VVASISSGWSDVVPSWTAKSVSPSPTVAARIIIARSFLFCSSRRPLYVVDAPVAYRQAAIRARRAAADNDRAGNHSRAWARADVVLTVGRRQKATT